MDQFFSMHTSLFRIIPIQIVNLNLQGKIMPKTKQNSLDLENKLIVQLIHQNTMPMFISKITKKLFCNDSIQNGLNFRPHSSMKISLLAR